ncbi:DUF4411 family protein [Lysobacter gummosus]|uniref:DUF4411 family protein n=1 Tax=Lysobacter gummosus TaxID=262324 RepID=A0ABY3XE68_9GAMM|nr:DUF4411 family protein [Lysobacter gummosus]UNP29301.1 DUF4411 family protein [Lysobacter gummosus]
MIYLVDANVLISAARTYYRFEWVPEFWAWLAHHCASGAVKMPIEIFEELKAGTNDGENDALYDWVNTPENKKNILLPSAVDIDLVQHVLDVGYGPNLTDVDTQKIARDPFLIAHALSAADLRRVVTLEGKAGSESAPHKRTIPDACDRVGAISCTPFDMLVALNFSTNWKKKF